MYIAICKIDNQCKFDPGSRAPKAGAGTTQRDRVGRVQDGGAQGHPWLIHVDVWQKPSQYCKVIILQLKQIN